MRKLHHRYMTFVFSLLTVLLMSCFMSLVVLVLNNGLTVSVLKAWPGSWAGAFAVGFPAAMVVIPFVQWLVDKVIQSRPD